MIKKIIVTLICILALPILVNADMGAPETYHYEVIITNPNGVEIEDYNGAKTTIPYDTKVTVHFEYEKDSELYLDVEYNGIYGQISSKDAKLFSEEIDFTNFNKNEPGIQYYTLENVEMYKGPSTMYGKAGKIIPKGVTLDFEYRDEQWAYIEYEGIKGWIYVYQYEGYTTTSMTSGVVIIANKNTKVLVLKDKLSVYADRYKKNLAGELEPGEYDVKYYSYTYPRNTGYYIETDKISGWVYMGDSFGEPTVDSSVVSTKIKLMHNSDKPLELYKNIYDEKPTKLSVDKYTLLDAQYSVTTEILESDYDNWNFVYNQAYQVTYEGEKYWLKGDSELFITSYSKGIYTLKEDLIIYKEPQSVEKVTTIKSGETIDVLLTYYTDDNSWYYIEHGEYKGWAQYETIKYSKQEFEYFDEMEEVIETPEQPEEPAQPVAKKKISGLQIGLICGGAAIIATLTAIVSIILINKKKKNKKEETVVEAAPVVTTTEDDNKIKVPSTTGVLPVVKEEDSKNEE